MTKHNCQETTPTTIVPTPLPAGSYRFQDPQGKLQVQLRAWNGSATCRLDSEDFNDLGLSAPSSVTLHPDLHDILNDCIANINWFSSRYGNNYGDIEVIAHWGGPRKWFRFSGAANAIRPGKAWSQNDIETYLSQGVADDTLKDSSGVEGKKVRGRGYGPKQITPAQLKWLQSDERLGSDFKINASWHYHDRAFDIYWIGWKSVSDEVGIVRHASRPCFGGADVNSSTHAYRRLVAVEAGLRKWFGGVLNRNWNVNRDRDWPAHRDHFHVDNGACVDLKLQEDHAYPLSDVMFIQSCIEAFTDIRLSQGGTHFGFYGGSPKEEHKEQSRLTKEGYEVLLSDLGMSALNPQQNINHYYLLLDYIMMHGFANKRAGAYQWTGWDARATSPPV